MPNGSGFAGLEQFQLFKTPAGRFFVTVGGLGLLVIGWGQVLNTFRRVT